MKMNMSMIGWIGNLVMGGRLATNWPVLLGVMVCAALSTAGTARAEVIAFDDFTSYTNGAIAGQSGGTGYSDAWSAPSGGTAIATGTSLELTVEDFDGSIQESHPLAANTTFPTDGSAAYAAYRVRIHSNGGGQVIQSGLNLGGATFWLFGVNGLNFYLNGGGTAGTVEYDTDYLLVSRLIRNDAGNDSVVFWVDPSSESDTPLLTASSSFNNSATNLSRFTFDIISFGSSPDTFIVSYAAIGTTFNDVIPVSNQSPVAVCTNVTVSAGTNCMADASIDDGSYDPDDDPITTTQSPEGPYPLGTNDVTLTVVDDHGATNTCIATVIVMDTTAPTITCPSNMTVQATSAEGAIVNFSAVASDNCGSAEVTYEPEPGSTFPIGVTTVQCTATDDAGNESTCSFDVTVGGPLDITDSLLGQLIDLRDTVTDRADGHKLNKAIRALTKATESSCWIDETHLQSACGGSVFDALKACVTKLGWVARKNPDLTADLQDLIDNIVVSARILVEAELAVQDNAKAEDDLDKGDSDASVNRPASAIGHYKDAWKALKKNQS